MKKLKLHSNTRNFKNPNPSQYALELWKRKPFFTINFPVHILLWLDGNPEEGNVPPLALEGLYVI